MKRYEETFEQLEDMCFTKYDNDKLKYHLIPAKELEQIVQIFTFGANKYGENNWQKCDDINRYVDALYRHLEAWRKGEKMDLESGKSHLAHVAVNAIFVLYLDNNKDKNNE